MGEPRDFKFGSSIFLSKSHLWPWRWKIFPERGMVRVRWPVVQFYSPCNISTTANARDFKFFVRRSAMWSLSLVMSECSLSGRGQGHMINFYIVDLEKFATASRRYTGDIHNTFVVGLFMTPIWQWKWLDRVMVVCTCLLHIGPL